MRSRAFSLKSLIMSIVKYDLGQQIDDLHFINLNNFQ